jgi:UV DNA damage endonuclease
MDSVPPYRLGFAVKVLGDGGLRSHDARRWQSGPHLSRSLELLDAVFDYLDRHDLRVYRMSSATIPYGTHPDLPQLHYRRQLDECADAVAALGVKARRLGLRLSTHPGQYTVVNSPDPEIARKALLDLEQDTALLDALGAGPEAVVVVHVGGVYGDKPAASERFARAWERLSDRAKERVAIENDESCFDVADVLELHRRLGLRVVFDWHHHRCKPAPTLADPHETVAAVYGTWPASVRPKVHLSSPRTALDARGRPPKLDQHADFVTPWELLELLRAAPGPIDVMLEAKAKDLAVSWLRKQMRQKFDMTEAGYARRDPKRKEPRMAAISKYVTVEAPVEKVYAYWRDFTNFPRFMPHVKEVTPVDGDDSRTHWKVDGPLGVAAEWDAELVEDVPNERIAWRSVEGSRIENSGVVRFDSRNDHTDVEVSIDYEPPAGAAGEAAARMFENPEEQVQDALDRFNEIVRGW